MNAPHRRPLVLRDLRPVRRLAHALARRRVSPNVISVCGAMFALAAGVAWSFTSGAEGDRALWLLGVALVVLRILANTLDGMDAVEHGKGSPDGMLYNEAPDRIADSALLIGAGYAHGGMPELGYLAACVAPFVSYVRTLGRVAGAPSDFSGPMDKRGRMITLLAAAMIAGLTPSPWQEAAMLRGRFGVMSMAPALVILGGIYTAAKQLRRAASRLRGDA